MCYPAGTAAEAVQKTWQHASGRPWPSAQSTPAPAPAAQAPAAPAQSMWDGAPAGTGVAASAFGAPPLKKQSPAAATGTPSFGVSSPFSGSSVRQV